MKDFITLSDFSYELPEERIAKYPLKNRDESKLLIYTRNTISEDRFSAISKHLPDQCQLFYNNTRVIHARLKFKRTSGAAIEIFCLNPIEPFDYQLAFSASHSCSWHCLVGNLKKWKEDELILTGHYQGEEISLRAKKLSQDKKGVDVQFNWEAPVSFGEMIDHLGVIPIPPYLNRDSEAMDTTRYQTVYSRYDGSVAAPTAGLHFTPELMENLRLKGINSNELTLHVGAGTFQPIKAENVLEHVMHAEFFTLPLTSIEPLCYSAKINVATGTTTLRTLESLYWLAVKSVVSGKLQNNLEQWEYKDLPQDLDRKEVFAQLINLVRNTGQTHYAAHTGIMITPGYEFKVVEGLITNYHQPGSTLLLLIAAFIGEDWKKVYQYALNNTFRFLSYGDSSLLWRK